MAAPDSPFCEYHRKVADCVIESIDVVLTEAELTLTLFGSPKGDGRASDQYCLDDQVDLEQTA